MASSKNVKLYQVANPFKKMGRPRLYDTAEELWSDFVEYCKWRDDNPWQNKAASKSQNAEGAMGNERQSVAVKQLPYTLYEFTAYASINSKWADFKRSYSEYGNDFSEVINAIEQVCVSQQIGGAIINEYNSNIVARINNIAEVQKVDVTSNGERVEGFVFPKLSKEDFEELQKINQKDYGKE